MLTIHHPPLQGWKQEHCSQHCNHVPQVKAETRVVTAETRPVPVKSLPITPTIGRVKQELGDARAFKLSATSIMSPELAR